jgi:hypothetical protein
MKNKNYRYPFSCFLWFQEQVLIVKKITQPGSGRKFIPDSDPGGEKAPDPRSRSATLLDKLPIVNLNSDV